MEELCILVMKGKAEDGEEVFRLAITTPDREEVAYVELNKETASQFLGSSLKVYLSMED